MSTMGRPTKYKPEYCEEIVKFMAKGNSVVQFAASIMVAKQSVYDWAQSYPDFSYALKMGQSLCEAHWEKIGQIKTVRKTGGSDSVFRFYMANRFGWSDKVDQNIKSEETVTFTTQIGEDGTVNREKS